ncbi:MAG: hypothetical protein Q7S48_03985 [bacterium]|nr:hypothetical protein [bacterium]
MSHRKLSLLVICSIVLGMGAVLVPREGYAQMACTMGPVGDTQCSSTLGAEFRCVSNRCNLPAPIWNSVAPGIGEDGQVGSFDVRNNSRVRGDFTVGNTDPVLRNDTGNLRVNAIYSRLGESSEDNIWLGDENDSIRVLGDLRFGLDETPQCVANEILKRNAGGTAWTCGTDATGAGATSTRWPTLIEFPSECDAGQFVTGVGATLSCATPASGGGTGLSGGALNKVAFWTGGSALGQNANFHLDITTPSSPRLGIGTATPEFTLDVQGNRIIVRNAANAEIDLKSGTDQHWGIYSDLASDELRFWRDGDQLLLSTGGDLTITGGAVLGADLSAVNLSASSQIRTPLLCLGIDCRGAWPVAGGGGAESIAWSAITAFPSACLDGEYVAGVGTGGPLTCRTLPAAPGGGGAELDPLYAAWYNNGSPTISGALSVGSNFRVTGGGAFGGYTPDATWRITTPSIYIGDGANGTIIGAGDAQRAGDITTDGNLSARGCLGPVVVGATAGTVNGDLNGAGAPNDGYRGADGLCNTAFNGSHQCATNEVMTSIHCGSIWTSATKTTLQAYVPIDTFVWISNGAPSLPTPTNDCYGWTETAVVGGQQSQGIAWEFNVAGGGGYARPCNQANRILCCR